MTQRPSSNLDLLRSIAVILVLAQHLLRRIHIDQIAWIATTSLGLFGVLLFFVHTALVLMSSLERAHLTGWPLMRNFYVRRVFRIYPLSILAVLTALTLRLGSDANGIPGLSDGAYPGKRVVLSNLLLIQDLVSSKSIVNVLWSLPFELQMYLFLPFIFLWIGQRRRIWHLLCLWAIATIAATAQMHFLPLPILSILRFLPNFIPGIVAFALPSVPRIKALFWPMFVGAIVVAYTLHPGERMGWLLCLVLGLCIPLFAEITHPWICWTSKRIATYSYGIYLSHQFCIWTAFGVLREEPPWIKGVALLGLLVVVPIALYHGIEKPLIGIGSRLVERSDRSKPKRSLLVQCDSSQAVGL